MNFYQLYDIFAVFHQQSQNNSDPLGTALAAIGALLGGIAAGFFGRILKDREDKKKLKKEVKEETEKELISPLQIKLTEQDETIRTLRVLLDQSQDLQLKQEAYYTRELASQEIRFNARVERLEKECQADRVLASEKIAILEVELDKVKAQYGATLALNEEYLSELDRLRKRKGTTGELAINPATVEKEATRDA